jgi:hypothetical protein
MSILRGWGLTAPEIDRRVRAGGRESESLVGRVEGFDYNVRGPGDATLGGTPRSTAS